MPRYAAAVAAESEVPMTILDRPVTCKCGQVFTTLESAKVHVVVMSVMPFAHVRKAA